MTVTAPVYDPLTEPVVKHLGCGHTRTCCTAAPIGLSVHCVSCASLQPVESISMPNGARLGRLNAERLRAAGLEDQVAAILHEQRRGDGR